MWIIHGSAVEGRLKRDVVVLSHVLGGSQAWMDSLFVAPNSNSNVNNDDDDDDDNDDDKDGGDDNTHVYAFGVVFTEEI